MKINKILTMLIIGCLFSHLNGTEEPKKKILDLAWGSPTVEFLAENLIQMEKEAPVDGLMIRWYGEKYDANGKKKTVILTHCMSKTPLKRDYFKKQIEI